MPSIPACGDGRAHPPAAGCVSHLRQLGRAQRRRRRAGPRRPAAHRATPRAGARRRDRPRPRPAPLERLPPAGGAAPRGLRRPTCPRSAATASAWPPSSWARRTPGRSRCSGSRGRSSPGWSTATTHNAHLAVLHGRDVLYVVEERAAGRPPLVTDVGVRLPAHLTASGLAMLAALPPAQVRALFPSRAAFVQRHGIGPGVAARPAPGAHAGTTRRLRPRGRLGHPRLRVGGVGRAGPLRPPGRRRRGDLPGARGDRGGPGTAGHAGRGGSPRAVPPDPRPRPARGGGGPRSRASGSTARA